ncbi:MAG: HNH endonuclease [Pseudomonadota bacterium]
MKTLSKDQLSKIRYDPDTGVFTWAVPAGSAGAGRVAGCVNRKGYRQIRLGGGLHSAHRLAWLITYGAWPSGDIDHINGNKDDNRLENLRDVASTINMQNQRGPHKSNNSGLLGVDYHKASHKWRAQIRLDGKKHQLGLFDTAEDAHTAYRCAKRSLHAGCTI